MIKDFEQTFSPLEYMITALPPLDHQHKAFRRFHVQDFGAFFCEMGTGKTKMILDIAQNGAERNILVVAPNGLHLNWHHIEIGKHLHEEITYRSYCWRGRPTSEKAHKELHRFMVPQEEDRTDYNFFLINVEALRSRDVCDLLSTFLQRPGGSHMIIDESTCIKNPKAIQTRSCLSLAKYATRRWILNGTPITQGPLDLFSQCKFLHPEALPYRTYTAFKNTFAEETVITMQNRSFRKITGYRNLDRLTKEISHFSLHLKKEDCLDLPEKVFTEHVVEPSKEQLRAYREMKNLCLAELENGTIVTAAEALTRLMKLHQILTGFLTDEDGKCHDIPNNRISALQGIATTTKPLVVFCAYRHNVRQVIDALSGIGNAVAYYGDTSSGERVEAVEGFQSGKYDFFVGTSAAAKGLTLHRASNMVYYSNNYSLETRLQSQDRIHRIGTVNKCTYTDLVIPGTLDQRILQALMSKKELADTVLNDLKEMI